MVCPAQFCHNVESRANTISTQNWQYNFVTIGEAIQVTWPTRGKRPTLCGKAPNLIDGDWIEAAATKALICDSKVVHECETRMVFGVI